MLLGGRVAGHKQKLFIVPLSDWHLEYMLAPRNEDYVISILCKQRDLTSTVHIQGTGHDDKA